MPSLNINSIERTKNFQHEGTIETVKKKLIPVLRNSKEKGCKIFAINKSRYIPFHLKILLNI